MPVKCVRRVNRLPAHKWTSQIFFEKLETVKEKIEIHAFKFIVTIICMMTYRWL
jgi:hypothetical protein